jgi:superfamily II DNA or RNA helicase
MYPSAVRPGTRVYSRTDRSLVGTIRSEPIVKFGRQMCTVLWDGQRVPVAVPVVAITEDEVVLSAAERIVSGALDSLPRLMARLTHEKIADPRDDVIYSVRTAAADFHPYQFRPVVKLVREDAGGILIADEVGLGKTIEAGYILKELKARDRFGFKRAMIVCPATLRSKWQEEMSRRFGERFEILDADGLRTVIDRVSAQVGDSGLQVIVSYETIRVADIQSRLSELAPVDLVICDEAHHLRNPATRIHKALHDFRPSVSNLVLLSATPIQIRADNLRVLLALIAPDRVQDGVGFGRQLAANQQLVLAESMLLKNDPEVREGAARIVDELVQDHELIGIPVQHLRLLSARIRALATDSSASERVDIAADIRDAGPFSTILTRTRRRDVQTGGAVRRANVLDVCFSQDERIVHDWFLDMARRRYAEAVEGNAIGRMASVSLQRMFSSSLQASLRQIADQQALSGLDEGDGEGGGRVPAMGELPAEVRRSAESLLRGKVDTKYDSLLAAIRRFLEESPREKFVVFSFYKRTLAYLATRLCEDGIACVLIDGDVPSNPHRPSRDERGRRIRRFREDADISVLLSSEVGSEGLDFQDVCSTVVNYDLPWNPMRIEQRIGRVDRYGQQSPAVTVINFKVGGTIEDDVYQRLLDRIQIFRSSIGDLDVILGEVEEHIEKIVMTRGLSDADVERLAKEAADRVESLRRIAEEIGDAQDMLVSRDDSIDSVAGSQAVVTPMELANFVERGLHAMGVDASPAHSPRRTVVTSGKRLEEVLGRYLTIRDETALRDVVDLDAGGCELQYDNPRGHHHVSVAHPIVSACVRFFKSGQTDAATALHVEHACAARLSIQEIPHGLLAIGVIQLRTVSKRRTSNTVELVACAADGTALDAETAGRLLAALATGIDGCTGSAAPRLSAEQVVSLEALAWASQERVEAAARRRLEARFELRYAKERRKLLQRRDQLSAQTRDPSFGARQSQYQNMTMAGLAKVERQLAELEASHQDPAVPHVEMAWIGIVAVENAP